MKVKKQVVELTVHSNFGLVLIKERPPLESVTTPLGEMLPASVKFCADEDGGVARRTAHVPGPVVLYARNCCARPTCR